jgi:hypothetical protein
MDAQRLAGPGATPPANERPNLTSLLTVVATDNATAVDLLATRIVIWRRRGIGIIATIAIGRIVVSIGVAPVGITPTPSPATKPDADYDMVVAVMIVAVVEVPVVVMCGGGSAMKSSGGSTTKAPCGSTTESATGWSAMESATTTTETATTHLRVR